MIHTLLVAIVIDIIAHRDAKISNRNSKSVY